MSENKPTLISISHQEYEYYQALDKSIPEIKEAMLNVPSNHKQSLTEIGILERIKQLETLKNKTKNYEKF